MHQTDLVQTKLAGGGRVTASTKEWSIPAKPVAADAGTSFICWQKVAPVTRTLPHHDKRVLDEKPSHCRDAEISNQLILAHVSLTGEEHILKSDSTKMLSFTTLALPKRMGLPKFVNVDPVNQEWAVIATSKELLYIVSLRSCFRNHTLDTHGEKEPNRT